MDEPSLLHVYAQAHKHDDLYVVGNRGGLEKLKAVMTNDGEGFDAVVILCDDNWQGEAWTKMREPYTSESSRDDREDAVDPWEYVESKKNP